MTPVTIELEQAILTGLDDLAARFGKSRDIVLRDAVTSYLVEGEAFLAFLQEADDAIERGEFYTQEQMHEWVQSRRHAEAAE